MCLLLESASRGCNDAYLVLTRIPDVGLCNAMLNVAPLPMISRPSVERTQSLQHDRLVAERDLLDAVTVIGRCWRVGHRELRQDNDLATAWLRIASERMHPGASLQLGIHLVQIAESLDEVLAGIDILVKVVNVAPCPEAYEAAHRLGRYHHYGLPHEFCNSGFASDANDDEGCLRCPEKALYYIKMAAEGGVRDAMLLYSRLYRAGTPCLKQDEERAVEWEQRSGGATAFGYYLTGIARIKDARDDYREMHQRNKEKFERTISECSSTRSASFAEAKKKEKRTWGISSLGGIFNNGDKSNSSLTLEGKIREGFVDSEGNVTRAGIAQKFKVGTCYLLRGGAQVKESRPDEWCNPYPLLMAGQLMIQYRNVWAYCSADQAAAQQSFANDTFNTGVDLLNKAGYLMDNEPEWSKLRIDYRQEDLFIMRKARRQLDLLGPEGME